METKCLVGGNDQVDTYGSQRISESGAEKGGERSSASRTAQTSHNAAWIFLFVVLSVLTLGLFCGIYFLLKKERPAPSWISLGWGAMSDSTSMTFELNKSDTDVKQRVVVFYSPHECRTMQTDSIHRLYGICLGTREHSGALRPIGFEMFSCADQNGLAIVAATGWPDSSLGSSFLVPTASHVESFRVFQRHLLLRLCDYLIVVIGCLDRRQLLTLQQILEMQRHQQSLVLILHNVGSRSDYKEQVRMLEATMPTSSDAVLDIEDISDFYPSKNQKDLVHCFPKEEVDKVKSHIQRNVEDNPGERFLKEADPSLPELILRFMKDAADRSRVGDAYILASEDKGDHYTVQLTSKLTL